MTVLIAITGLLIHHTTQAQIVQIPDKNFKKALLNHYVKIDINNDNEIQYSEAKNFMSTSIDVSYLSIRSLKGIEAFENITELSCAGNLISSLDISNNKKLEFLLCSYNRIEKLSLKSNVNLEDVYCNDNNLQELNLANNSNNIYNFDCSNNPNLSYIVVDSKKNPSKKWIKDKQAMYVVNKRSSIYNALAYK